MAPPYLLAARPGRLAGRKLATRHAVIFLELVRAVERRHVGRGDEARPDAEAVDRRTMPRKRQERILVDPAARKDRDVGKAAPVEDAPHLLRERDHVAAVEAHSPNRNPGGQPGCKAND